MLPDCETGKAEEGVRSAGNTFLAMPDISIRPGKRRTAIAKRGTYQAPCPSTLPSRGATSRLRDPRTWRTDKELVVEVGKHTRTVLARRHLRGRSEREISPAR